ncbi:hypothetical protein HN014_19025 [Aquimarina sp. TRL1]|uniref:hypothetical protein n=1 Tax=Aquimarina sp. (strain TRL1) TaxID=2736252 RepID=UPI001588D983|nr:hypothetical protein [Aquimarina sp. TRL1]QKX06922.1 hypothetical protein HN014_19025 [Aquimarina sp. TRL1]
MKLSIYIILVFFFIACKNEKETPGTLETTVKNNKKSLAKNTDKTTSQGMLLCLINGKNWSYTEASGIITKNKRTNETLATVTFKQKINKKTESVQLYYDVITKKLKNISVSIYVEQNKHTGLAGGMQRTTYELFSTDKKDSNESMAGTIDTSGANTLSGNANAIINYNQKHLIKNKHDEILHITDLQFSNVGYSDLSNGLKF